MERKDTDVREYTEGIALKGKLFSWLDNFWYHYKWVTVGVAFFLIVAIVCTVQMCTKEENDSVLLYAGGSYLSAEDAEGARVCFESVLTRGDDEGERIGLYSYYVLSEDQIIEMERETYEDDDHVFVNRAFNSEQYSVYNKYVMQGESCVLLLEEWLYEKLLAADVLAPLENTLGYVPEGAVGAHGIRLEDTDIYREFASVRKISGKTVLCMLKPFAVGYSSKAENYNREKQNFIDIVTYRSAEN